MPDKLRKLIITEIKNSIRRKRPRLYPSIQNLIQEYHMLVMYLKNRTRYVQMRVEEDRLVVDLFKDVRLKHSIYYEYANPDEFNIEKISNNIIRWIEEGM